MLDHVIFCMLFDHEQYYKLVKSIRCIEFWLIREEIVIYLRFYSRYKNLI